MARAVFEPRICCLDLDTFFVSVERLLDPSLVGKPVVVGGRKDSRGVVLAASYEVRPLGVHSGMPMAKAVRLAPHAIYVPPRHGVYTPYGKQVREILERYTPAVQTASIDEFFLDFRGCERLWADPADADEDATIERIVWEMREVIQSELGLPASAGIAATRAVAKMASGRAKPAGVWMVRAGEEARFVGALPVRKYPGIGPKAEERLLSAGIRTLDQLLALPPGPVRARFGELASRVRRSVFGGSTGLGEDRPAFREHDRAGMAGSISNERTFREDVADPTRLQDQLRALVERVCWRARRREARARTITLKLRYSDFSTLQRSVTVAATWDEAVVLRHVRALFERGRTRSDPIRLLGVGLSGFEGPRQQLALPFGAAVTPTPGKAIDRVREKFGYDAIRMGSIGGSSWVA